MSVGVEMRTIIYGDEKGKENIYDMLKQENRENKIPVPISPCRDLRVEGISLGNIHILNQHGKINGCRCRSKTFQISA